jgi:hypothetical protein
MRRCERSFRCLIPERILEGAVSPPGLHADRTRRGPGHGCLGREPSLEHRVCSPSSGMHSARAMRHTWGRRRERQTAGFRNKEANLARAAQLAWGEIGTALPAQFRWRDTIRTEHLECSRTASAAASTYSPDQLDGGNSAATWPRRSRSSRCVGRRDSPSRAPRSRLAPGDCQHLGGTTSCRLERAGMSTSRHDPRHSSSRSTSSLSSRAALPVPTCFRRPTTPAYHVTRELHLLNQAGLSGRCPGSGPGRTLGPGRAARREGGQQWRGHAHLGFLVALSRLADGQ